MEDPMLSLDDETCIECGLCADLLPQYFELAEGKVRVRAGAGSLRAPPDEADIAGAVRDCPAGSIRP